MNHAIPPVCRIRLAILAELGIYGEWPETGKRGDMNSFIRHIAACVLQRTTLLHADELAHAAGFAGHASCFDRSARPWRLARGPEATAICDRIVKRLKDGEPICYKGYDYIQSAIARAELKMRLKDFTPAIVAGKPQLQGARR